MKLIKPRELCDLMNAPEGLPEGDIVQLCGGLRVALQRSADIAFFRYTGDMIIRSSGNRKYLIEDKGEKFKLGFEQTNPATIGGPRALEYLTIPVNIGEHGIVRIDGPSKIMY